MHAIRAVSATYNAPVPQRAIVARAAQPRWPRVAIERGLRNSLRMPDILPAPPCLDASDIGLFLDVDGTLLHFADTPDAVRASESLRGLLRNLEAATGGAVALISGRSIASLDAVFAPERFPAAGAHGLEFRAAAEQPYSIADATRLPQAHIDALRELTSRHDGLLMEEKSHGIALHYRNAPALEDELRERLHGMAAELGDAFTLIDGAKVFELHPSERDKGSAIRAFLDCDPWRDRMPVFIGDDTTDEAGFDSVNQLGGYAIRVGDRDSTLARWRLEDIDAVYQWLECIAGSRTIQDSVQP
jgi:trehalose 6-phosphate phosphatase